MLKKVALGVAVIIIIGGGFYWGSSLIATYYRDKGIEAYQKQRIELAQKYLANSLDFNSKDSLAHYYAGKAALGIPSIGEKELYPRANFTDAASHMDHAIALGIKASYPGFYADALNDAGFSYWILGNYERSLPRFIDRIAADPEHSFVARYFVALHYFNQANRPGDAIAVLLPALTTKSETELGIKTIEKNKYQVHALLARLYSFENNDSAAEQHAKLALDGSPNKPDENSLNAAIILSLLSAKESETKAISRFEEAVLISKALGYSENALECSRARLFQELKNYEKAIQIAKAHIENSVKFSYRETICLETLARSYFMQGNQADAKKYFEHYLSATNDFSQKNIYIIRNRSEFSAELKKS